MDSDWDSYQIRGSDNENDENSAEFKHLSTLITSNIQMISNNVQQVQRMVAQLSTSQDNDELRQRLHQMQHGTNELSKNTSHLLKDLIGISRGQRQWKLQRERLTNELMVVLNIFQNAQRQAADKEKASIKRVRSSAIEPKEEMDESRMTKMGQLQVEQHLDLEAIRTRQNDLVQLESDIGDVNQIFKDLALMVHDQGELVDSIEHNVDHAVIHVEQGASNVQRAAQYKQGARRKQLCLFIFALAVVLIVILVIYLYSNT